MPYIGHGVTNAGTFYVLDDLTMSSSTTYTLQVGGVSVTPKADNLLITLDGVIQHTPDAYTISGSTITFASAPGSGVDFYGIIMGQSASVGQGSIGADELRVTGDGSANQVLSSDADGTMTWKDGTLSTTSATGDIIYRNASGVLAKLAIGSTGQLLTVASGLPSWATDSEPYLPLAGGTMSGAINLGSQNVTNGGTITGTFVGGITGNVTGNTSGTALTVTQAAQSAITSVGTLTTLTVDDITINGSTITDGGDLDFDVGGNITLDADDAGEVRLKDGGTAYLYLKKDSTTAVLENVIQDGDFNFRGNDGGSGITALSLDMSEGGNATFAGSVFIDLPSEMNDKVWYTTSNTRPVQIRTTALTSYNDNQTYLSTGTYFDTNGNFKPIKDGNAMLYHQQDDGRHYWYTNAVTGTGNISWTERMKLDGSNLTVAGQVTVGSTDYVNLTAESYGGSVRLYNGGSNHFQLYHYNDNTLRINYNGSGGDEMTFQSNGDVLFAGQVTATGIKFDGSGEVLDDYEEGTWTPNVGAGITVSGTASATGSYTKIGNMVTLHCSITVSASGSLTVNSNLGVLVGVLPFTIAGSRSLSFLLLNSAFTQAEQQGAWSDNTYAGTAMSATTNLYFAFTYASDE